MFWHDLGLELRHKVLTPELFAVYLIKAIAIVVIVTAGLLLYIIAAKVIHRILRRDGRVSHERRARTLVAVIRSLMGYGIFFVVLVTCLRVLGVDYTAILAGAGVVGLAVGFGAQTLIRDFISGFFLLLEDLISVGDWITVGDTSGLVESVGLRITRLRAFDGTLHVIPNGELTRFGNANRKFMRAVVTVDLSYEQDAAKGMARAKEVIDAWSKEHEDVILEPPAVHGLLNLGESGVRIRVAVKVKPMQHWTAEQELRLRLKQAFATDGIEIPLPQRVVHVRDHN
jgi:moderate conductance mechanosensitive channel